MDPTTACESSVSPTVECPILCIPDELIGETLCKIDLLSLWICRTVCKHFRGIIRDLLSGPGGTQMREFTVRNRYAATLATGDPRMLQIIQEESTGLVDDMTFVPATQATTSLAMLKYVGGMGSPITGNVAMKALVHPTEAIVMFEWIKENYSYAVPELYSSVCAKVMQGGSVRTLDYLVGLGYPVADYLWECAKTPELIEWLKVNHAPYTQHTLNYVAHVGNTQLLQWLVDDGCKCNYELVAAAAKSGNLDAVKWARQQIGDPSNLTPVWDNAVAAGNIDLLQYLLDERSSLLYINHCPITNQLEVLKWAHAHSVPIDMSIYYELHSETVEWFMEMEIPFDMNAALTSTVIHKHKLFLKLLGVYLAKGPLEHITRILYQIACNNDRLDHLKRIHTAVSSLPPYDASRMTCHSAAVANWMIDTSGLHECVAKNLEYLILYDNIVMLRILHSRGLIDLPMLEPLRNTICESGCEIIQWAMTLGMRFTERDFAYTSDHCELEIMIFIHEHATINRDKFQFDDEDDGAVGVCQRIACYSNLEELRWAYSKCYPLSDKIFGISFSSKNYDIVKWAYNNGCPTGPWRITPNDNNRFTAFNVDTEEEISDFW